MTQAQAAPLNQLQFDPGLRTTLDKTIRAALLQMNCHAVATVESFDPTTLTLQATINYPMTFYRPDPVTGAVGPVSIEYPALVDCPVLLPQGGGFIDTFPIKKGDTCVILFNDRALDAWFHSGQVLPLNSNRLHAFEDAMAFVCIRGATDIPAVYDMTHSLKQSPDGTVQVGVSASQARIAKAALTLGATLTDLVTAITDLTNALTTAFAVNAINGSPLFPGWSAALTPVTTAITKAQNEITELLE